MLVASFRSWLDDSTLVALLFLFAQEDARVLYSVDFSSILNVDS